jgi:hypothetical protein
VTGQWFIYTLHDPRDPEVVKYVGFTTNLGRRTKEHLRPTAGGGRDYERWKASLLELGIKPVLQVIEEGFGSGWETAETRWIAHYRSIFGGSLTNRSAGGTSGARGHWKLSAETRAKMSLASKRRGFSPWAREARLLTQVGVPLSPEHREKMRIVSTGRKKSPEVIEKTASFWRGRKHSDVARERIKNTHSRLQPAKPKVTPKRSEESRQKTRDALKAHYATMGGGRKTTEEAKAKISAAVKAYRARKTV